MTHTYASLNYAGSLSHMGEPLAVPDWGGHVLLRKTPDGDHYDAVGPYPLTVLASEADLSGGLKQLKTQGLVSVVVVLETASCPPAEALIAAFDLARPFKAHHVHDRRIGLPRYGKHHRYEIKRAHARVEAREIALSDHLTEWTRLYGQLIARHGLSGVHVFPDVHHHYLATTPALRAFGAFIEDRLVSAHLFVVHERRAISHLAASSAEGYAAGAAYAVNDVALAGLSDCETIDFGGGAGTGNAGGDGLSRFKAGFANTTETAWLCGAILDPDAYQALSAGRRDNSFFPTYRGPIQSERSDAHQR